MDATRGSEPKAMKNRTTVERTSERELVVTRTVNGPARIVFEAWTKPELFKRWWTPKSMGMSLRSCEMDVRVGGKYRLEFEPDAVAFFGTYLEVTPHSRLVWTNDEGDAGQTEDEREDAHLARGMPHRVVEFMPRRRRVDGDIAYTLLFEIFNGVHRRVELAERPENALH